MTGIGVHSSRAWAGQHCRNRARRELVQLHFEYQNKSSRGLPKQSNSQSPSKQPKKYKTRLTQDATVSSTRQIKEADLLVQASAGWSWATNDTLKTFLECLLPLRHNSAEAFVRWLVRMLGRCSWSYFYVLVRNRAVRPPRQKDLFSQIGTHRSYEAGGTAIAIGN